MEGETLTECVCFFQVRVAGNVSDLTKFFWVLQPKILTFGCVCSNIDTIWPLGEGRKKVDNNSTMMW